MTELYLKEVFSSLQGEGVLIGRRQLFVRFARCNLSCAYCDTDFTASPTWDAEEEPGGGSRFEFPNPATLEFLTELLVGLHSRSPFHHSLALTGGEPLVQTDALTAWLPVMSKTIPVYLETNGTLPDAMERVLPWVSWVSMDIKLATASGAPTPWEEHAEFLSVSSQRLCQVKVVVDRETPSFEVVEAAGFVHRLAPGIPLVLQPVTVNKRPSLEGNQLLSLQDTAARVHPATLVIPQMHPLLSIR